MSSSLRLVGLIAALALVLAGCNGEDDDAASSTTTTSAEVDAAGSTSTSGAGPRTTTTVASSSTIAVVLASDRLVVGGNALVYGAPRSQVRAYLDRALGAPTATATQECGPGKLESFRWKGITAFVAEDGFGGWSVEDGTYATERGVRVGSSRNDVEVAHPGAEVTEGSLGTEFFVPGPEEGTGLSGVYEDDEVVALWSGATCVAR